MKVLMIGGDRNMLLPGGEASRRLELQRGAVEELKLYVWPYQGFLAPLIEKKKFNVVTAQDPFWRGAIAWFLAWRMRARLNLQIHTDLSAQSLLRCTLAKFLLRRADSVRVVSEKIKQQVEKIGVQVPITVLPIYIDVSRFRNIVHQPHSKKTILWIGRFEPEKDPLYALRVFEKVREVETDAKLIMLGTGSLENSLRAQAKGLQVEFPGWQDPQSYLSVAHVVLSTSLHESFGVSMIEALAAHVPVVASDVGVAREAGAIVVPREKLVKAVVEVLRSGSRGELKLSLLSASEWAKKWKQAL